MGSWLELHIKDFILPELGFLPKPNQVFSNNELTAIKNIWRAAKRNSKGKRILLAGRDVWIFEVLARRENFPTLFHPEISREVAINLSKTEKSKLREYYLFDTGFVGTVPKALGIEHFNLASGANQVFRNMKAAKSLASKIEELPKYWNRGVIFIDGNIIQTKSPEEEFAKAAAITLAVYKNSAPRFVEKIEVQ